MSRAGVQAYASAAPPDAAGGSGLLQRLKDEMKAAMKARDGPRLETIRFLSAAVKQREIELREGSVGLSDADVVGVIKKLAKQRRDSIDSYRAGGRQDLVDKEVAELAVLESYLPQQLSREAVAVAVDEAVAQLGATSVKQMGQVMKAVAAKTQGLADNKLVSELVKARLSS